MVDDAILHAPRRSRNYVGQTVGNKYVVKGLVGEGGMGAVYEVKHVAIGRRFAIKFLHWEISHSDTTVARFKREAEAAGRLENEHVVAVVDVGATDEGTPYLVMEYLQGENLGTLLARCGPLPVGRAVQLVLQACHGLEAAHAHGMIHRDLKPANLFVVQGGLGADVVKILDFGIVKLTDEDPAAITHSGLTLGTPFYMSPEQARGDSRIDGRTDIYALGVVLYELLTANKPHPGSNATAVLFHLLKQEPIRVETLRPGLPAGLADVVHRAFAFDAAERFADVASLREALAPYAAEAGARDDVPGPLPEPSLGGSSGTLSSTELQLPQGALASPSRVAAAATRATPERATSGGRRSLGAIAAFAFVGVAASLLLFGRGPRAYVPENATPSSPSPAAEPPSPPQVSAAVSGRAVERPIGQVSAGEKPAPSAASSVAPAVPARNSPLPRRPQSPAAAGSARQLLRDQLYEP